MRRYIPVLSVLIVLVAAGLVRQLKAYVLFGPAWPTNQVQYYINPSNLYVSNSAAIAALQSAASNWSTQSSANMKLVYAGTTTGGSLSLDYMNTVFFRDDSNGYYAAETYYWNDANNHIVDADIVFHEASYVFFTGNTGCTGAGEYIEDVGTHEFGHMQGLAHTPVTTATMYPTNTYCDVSWETLDPDDISGIQALYPPVSGGGTGGGGGSTTLPAAPSGLGAVPDPSNPSSGSVVSWTDNASNATGYNLQRSSDGTTFSQLAQLGSSATYYTDSGLSSGATYYYRVAAYNSAGSSAFSNTGSVQTQASSAPTVATVPAVPSGNSPTNGATNVGGNGSLTLSWAPASGAQSYAVYFGTSTTPNLLNGNVTSTSVSVGSLSSGTTYYWMVVAKNSVGSTASPLWRFTTSSKTHGKK